MLILFNLKDYSSNYKSSHLKLRFFFRTFMIYFYFLNRFFSYKQSIKCVNFLEGQVESNPIKTL